MQHDLSAVQGILFESLKRLTEKNTTKEEKEGAIEEAKATTGLVGAYVDTLKVEIVYSQMTHSVSKALQRKMGFVGDEPLDLKKVLL